MTRYLFEFLAYIEKNGKKAYSIRELSDCLCISGSVVSKCMGTAVEQGWIAQTEQELSITESGLLALEPYRVKRAIILAAGFGSRMMPATSDKPKPVVTVNGVRIIDTLDQLLPVAQGPRHGWCEAHCWRQVLGHVRGRWRGISRGQIPALRGALLP